MERAEEVRDELGTIRVDILFEEVQNGKIKELDMKQIALAMDPTVHGEFEFQKNKGISPQQIMSHLLDKWYVVELWKEEINSPRRLNEVLQNCGFSYLIKKMTEAGKDAHIQLYIETDDPGPPSPAPLLSPPASFFSPSGAQLNNGSCGAELSSNKLQAFCISNNRKTKYLPYFCSAALTIISAFLLYFVTRSNSEEVMKTRSVRFEGEKIVDFHDNCESMEMQPLIPDLDISLHGNSAVFLPTLSLKHSTLQNVLLVCGGTDGKLEAKFCWYLSLGDKYWTKLPFKLQQNRQASYIKTDGDSVEMIGGYSPDAHTQDCTWSVEILQLNNVSAGWQLTNTKKPHKLCSTNLDPNRHFELDIPCI